MRVSAGSGDCPITGLISARSNNRSEAARVPPSETAVAFVWQHLAFGGWLSSRIGPIGQIRRMRVSAGGGDCPVTGLISARPENRGCSRNTIRNRSRLRVAAFGIWRLAVFANRTYRTNKTYARVGRWRRLSRYRLDLGETGESRLLA